MGISFALSVRNKFVRPLDKLNTSCYDVLRKGRYSMDVQLKRGLLDGCRCLVFWGRAVVCWSLAGGC